MTKPVTKLLLLLLPILIACKFNKTPKNNDFKLLDMKKKVEMTILQYNVENLFNTTDDARNDDREFTPNGYKQWNNKKYSEKLINLSKVIAKIPGEDLPTIINLNEIENKGVVENLIHTSALKNTPYSIVHFQDYDPRGIENAIVYDKRKLKLLDSYLLNQNDHPFRKPLYAKFLCNTGDTLNIITVHLPSRRKGQRESEGKRMEVIKNLSLEIETLNLCYEKCIIMGDFNDEPFDKSLNFLSNASCFINPASKMPHNSGTIVYKGKAQIFDQILFNKQMTINGLHYNSGSLKIYNPGWIRYKKKPNRSYVGNRYVGGFSDHFPIYCVLKN